MRKSTFTKILSRYPPAVQHVGPTWDLGSAGGLSGSLLSLYISSPGVLVVRGWPVPGPSRQHVEKIHQWLRLASDLEFLPVPIADRSGATVQEIEGRLWEIAPWKTGKADLAHPPQSKHVRWGFQGLAAFHQRLALWQTHDVSPGIQERIESIRRLANGGFAELERALSEWPARNARELQLGERWIELARGSAAEVGDTLAQVSALQTRLQPVLRDARGEHLLFTERELSGLVDFGAMGIESVAADLGRLIGDWLGDDLESRRLALESYESVRPLDSIESRLIPAFTAGTSLLIGERWIRWHFLERRAFDDPSAVASGLTRSIRYLEQRVLKL